MKLRLEEFWNKRVGITHAGHFRQGVLSKEKSQLKDSEPFITLVNVSLYDEYRTLLSSIDSAGLFDKSQP